MHVIHMRNITLSVDEDSYRNGRIAAAHRGTSVSGLVREFFRSLQAGKTDPDRQVEELFEVMFSGHSISANAIRFPTGTASFWPPHKP
jgi:hypothetical protein